MEAYLTVNQVLFLGAIILVFGISATMWYKSDTIDEQTPLHKDRSDEEIVANTGLGYLVKKDEEK